jgi:hypothetical protein
MFGSASRLTVAPALLATKKPLSGLRRQHVLRCTPSTARLARRYALYPTETEPESPAKEMAANVAGKAAPGRVVLETEDELKSTDEHRVTVATATALMLGTFISGVSSVSGFGDYLSVAAGMVLAWVLSDLGSGIYHWGVDNYGSGKTPVFGGQIAAFQGHHQRPWTITEREFCNNVHKVFGPARVPAAILFVLSLVHPGDIVLASLSSFLFLVCMSQQFHAWSHMKKSELPAVVDAMQEAGLLISRRDHGAHHKAPFDGNYCIVSGLWNPILDQNGDENAFFRALERLVHKATGVEPRCWLEELPEDWQELTREDMVVR